MHRCLRFLLLQSLPQLHYQVEILVYLFFNYLKLFKISLRSFPGGGNGNPLQYSCLEKSWTEESGGLKSMGLHDWACVHEGGRRWVGSNKLVELKKKKKRFFPIYCPQKYIYERCKIVHEIIISSFINLPVCLLPLFLPSPNFSVVNI